jgi:hypothetical protein
MAAYLIKKVEAYADTKMMEAVTEEIPLGQGDTAPAFPAVVPVWKKDLIHDESRSNAMHINLEIIKARLEHLDSLQNSPLPDIDGRSYDLIRARTTRDLRFIRGAVLGDKSVRKQVAKEAGAAAAIGLLSAGILGFLATRLSIVKEGLIWFAAIPVAIAALVGLDVFLKRKAQQNIEAHKLAARNYEELAERMQDALEKHFAQLSDDVSEAIELCNKGVDDLISSLMKTVGQDIQTKVVYALKQGLGPYWEESER